MGSIASVVRMVLWTTVVTESRQFFEDTTTTAPPRRHDPPSHPKSPCGDEVRQPTAYLSHQHARRGPCAVLPVLSQASEGCPMLGDTDRVFRPHHCQARAEKEGACVGVAVNVERDRIICDRWAVLPVLSQSPEECQMLGDTDRVLRPHHGKARAEKEGACVGVAVNVERQNHL